MCILPSFGTSGLAASLLSFPGEHASLVDTSVLVAARKSTRSQCFHGRNLLPVDDREAHRTENFDTIVEI